MPEVFDSKRDLKSKKAKSPEADLADQPVVEPDSEESTLPYVSSDSPLKNRSVDEYSQVMVKEKPARNPFRAFAPKPVNTFFDTVDSDETVLLLLRQHPVTQVKWVVIAAIMAFVPFLLSFVNVLSFLPLQFHVVAGVAWYMMIIGFSLESFLSWFFNCYIITDERVIDVDFKSLLFKNISYAKFDKIEDINFTTSGSLGAIFDFGTVVIQTAAATDEFEFEDVPYPSQVTAFINDLLTEMQRQNGSRRNN